MISLLFGFTDIISVSNFMKFYKFVYIMDEGHGALYRQPNFQIKKPFETLKTVNPI